MVFVIELIILCCTVAYIGYPLFSKNYIGLEMEDGQNDDYYRLLSNKDMTISAIKDLEFDYLTGKLSEDDFNELKSQYEAEAVELLEKIDGADKAKKGAAKSEKKRLNCSKCGMPFKRGDRFCSKCGTKLS